MVVAMVVWAFGETGRMQHSADGILMTNTAEEA